MKKVSIIILNYNGWKDTLECLESVGKLETGNWKLEVVVVDNGSERMLKQFQHDKLSIKFINNQTNLGFAEGNSVGIRYALKNGADYIMILNNDTTVDKNLVSELLRIMEENKNIGIIGPKIYFSSGYEYHHDWYKENERGKVLWYAGGLMDWQNVIGSHRGVDEVDRGQYDLEQETDFISGCCMMIKREVFEKIGFFDEKYFLYWEDNDLCQRAKRAGFKVVYASKAIVSHKNAGSAGGSGSDLQDYYITRNRPLFGMKYAPWKSKLALKRESVKLFFFGRKWQKKGVADFYLGKFGKGSYKA